MYSHWQQTGPAPRPHAKSDPLASAIRFARYRLTVVSGWPEGEVRLETAKSISCALEQLESQREHREETRD